MNKILEEEIQKGRTIIVTIIVAIIITTLSTALIVTAYYNLLFEPSILLYIISFLLTIFLLWLLYKGYNWARWVNIVLFTLSGAFTIFFGLELLTKSIIFMDFFGLLMLFMDFFGLLMLIMSVAYLGSAGFLLFSSNVTTFLNYQKSKMDKYKTKSLSL